MENIIELVRIEQEIKDTKLTGNFEKLENLTKRRQRQLNHLLKTHGQYSEIFCKTTCVNTNENLYIKDDYIIAVSSPFSFLLDPFMYDFDIICDDTRGKYKLVYVFNGTRADDIGLRLEITVYKKVED